MGYLNISGDTITKNTIPYFPSTFLTQNCYKNILHKNLLRSIFIKNKNVII